MIEDTARDDGPHEDIAAIVSRAWTGSRADTLKGAPHLGIAALQLVSEADATQEIFQDVLIDTYKVSTALRAFDGAFHHDGRLVHSGRAPVGAVDILRPGETASAIAEGPWELLKFFLPVRVVNEICASDDTSPGAGGVELITPAASVDPQVLALSRRLRAEMHGPAAFRHLIVDLLSQELIVHLLRTHSSVSDAMRAKRPQTGGLAPWQVKRACEAMDALLEGEVSLAVLGEAAGCSPTHFSRAFKQSTGVAPFAWLLHRRIERAQGLLLDPRMPLADIALAVGFAAQPQFTTAFKRVTGATPGAWRRQRLS